MIPLDPLLVFVGGVAIGVSVAIIAIFFGWW